MVVEARFFSDSYIPKIVVDRDAEKARIADYLRSVLDGSPFRTLYVYGSSGVGKTVTTRHVLSQLELSRNDVSVAFIDSAGLTRYQVLCELHANVCGRPTRKLTCFELTRRIIGRLRSKETTQIIALDNFDKIEEVENLLWDLNAIQQKILKPMGLILISTSRYDLPSLIGNRLYSRLKPELLFFKPYDAEILFEILRERMFEAYGRMVAEEQALVRLCGFVEANGGSARLALELFLDCASEAQRGELKKVTVDVVADVLKDREREILLRRLHELRSESPKIFEVLRVVAELEAEGKQVYTGLIEDVLKRKGLKVSRRSLEYYLNELKRQGYIELRRIKLRKGFSSGVNLTLRLKRVISLIKDHV